MRIIPAFAVLSLLAAPLLAQQTVSCGSNGSHRQYCQADTRDGVLLLHDHSHGACRYGQSWGFNDHAIFVDNGCSADFLVTDHHGHDNDHDRGNYGNNGNPQGSNEQGYGNPGGGPVPYDAGQDHEGPHNIRIPSGTRIQVSLNQGVDPNRVHPGDLVPAVLTTDLVVNGTRIAHAGTPVVVTVTALRRDRPDPLTVQLTGMTVHHEHYDFNSTSIHSDRDAVNAQNNGGSLGAALGGLLNGGRQAGIPQGSVFNFQLVNSSRPAPIR